MGGQRPAYRLELGFGGSAAVHRGRTSNHSLSLPDGRPATCGADHAGSFSNLTPLFAAMMSSAFLSETAHFLPCGGFRTDRRRHCIIVKTLAYAVEDSAQLPPQLLAMRKARVRPLKLKVRLGGYARTEEAVKWIHMS